MRTLRIALGQVNPTVGDLDGNSALIRQAVTGARDAGADLVVLPEMVLTGYPVEDLSLRPSFQEASRAAMTELAADIASDGNGDLVCLVGYLDHSDEADLEIGRPRGAPLNSAALVHDGRVLARYDKHFLPNYGVFDEARYFVPGNSPLIVDIDQVRVCVAICEDLWRDGGPVEWARDAKADLVAVLNASPYERMKDDVRLQLCIDRARDSHAAIAYANMIGGQDELVFDGDSIVVDASGRVMERACQFGPDLITVDLDFDAIGGVGHQRSPATVTVQTRTASTPPAPAPPGLISPRLGDRDEVYAALRMGLADYIDKNGFRSVLLGLSGGIDSAFVGALAVDALGADRVFGAAMPSRYSSTHSVEDAHDLARRTGLSIRDVPIAPMFDAFQGSLDLSGLAEENLQARIRGMILMALSNAEGHLVLATGNKSELSVGYSTIYGDAVGGFAPIKDVPKTLVWELARWRNEQALARGEIEPIPPRSITKEPSAELRPDQRDVDSLPDYELLDALLEDYVDEDTGARDLVAAGFDAALVERVLGLTDSAEYKRRQYPPGTKIGARAFGRDRRLPITNRWRERA